MILIKFLAIFYQSLHSQKPENWYDPPQAPPYSKAVMISIHQLCGNISGGGGGGGGGARGDRQIDFEGGRELNNDF